MWIKFGAAKMLLFMCPANRDASPPLSNMLRELYFFLYCWMKPLISWMMPVWTPERMESFVDDPIKFTVASGWINGRRSVKLCNAWNRIISPGLILSSEVFLFCGDEIILTQVPASMTKQFFPGNNLAAPVTEAKRSLPRVSGVLYRFFTGNFVFELNRTNVVWIEETNDLFFQMRQRKKGWNNSRTGWTCFRRIKSFTEKFL